MTRSELIERIANKNPHLMLKDVERIVAVVFDKIISSLAALFRFVNARPGLPKIPAPANRFRLKNAIFLILKPENNCMNC